jgi:AraC-like DNA-binding protein
MRNDNVCKFPLPAPPSELSVSCFVLETNKETMVKTKVLKANRMILVEGGEGIFSLEGKEYPFSVGTLIFGFEGERFALMSGEGIRYLYIDFSGSRGESLLHRFGIHPYARFREGCNALIPFCKECLVSTPQGNVDVVAECVLLYVFSRLSVHRDVKDDVLQRVLLYTEENFRDPELSISLVAREIGYNAKYLSHFFRERMNVGYSEYLRSVRFKYAISLFELGISSVKNVALLSGFSDPLYFSSAFKKAIGISPSDYISSLSKDGGSEEEKGS